MAVIEIAKIQVRRGQEGNVGMPQLDSGEFGWAVDTQTLYIGNGSVAEGAPAVGNTQVVTANNISNFFNLNATYQYGSSYNTIYSIVDPNIQSTVVRSVSAKLDDFVNVVDFGAVGNWNGTTGTNNTAFFQTALNNIFLNTVTTGQRLRIPAGTYYFASPIYLPPNTTIVGDGPGKTILINGSGNNLIQTEDGYGVYFGSSSLMSGNVQPTNIRVEGMTLQYNTVGTLASYSPLLSLDCAAKTQVVNCAFIGLYTGGTTSTTFIGNSNNAAVNNLNSQYDGYTGIDIRSQGPTGVTQVSSNDLLIKDCVFVGLTNGIRSTYDCSDIVVSNNIFDTVNRGINWAPKLSGLLQTSGPIRTKINGNIFTNVYNEGIYAGASSVRPQHVSSFNSFYNVGTHLNSGINSDLNAVTSIINFVSLGNVSIEDKFDRDAYLLGKTPQYYIPSVIGKTGVSSNVSYTANLTTSSVLINIPYIGNDQVITVPYLYTSSGVSGSPSVFVSRKGILSIGVSTVSVSATVSDTFTYTYNGGSDPEPLNGLNFTASLNNIGNYIQLSYTANYVSGTIEYQYNYLG